MKHIILGGIKVYVLFIAPLAHQLLGVKTVCRHTPTCKVYAQQVITHNGIGKGIFLALRRIINCQPYFSI